MKEKIKIIGNGYWGEIIKTKLEKYDVSFFDPRIEDLKTLNNIDFIIVATPGNTHYEIVKNIILNTNIKKIFCEKPFTINYLQSLELFDLGNKNNVDIYIDDVFCFNSEYINLKQNIDINEIDYISFSWEKFGDFKDNIFSDLVYHDIYLLYDLLGAKDIKIEKINHQNKDKIIFSILYGDIKINFNYDRTVKNKKEKIIDIKLKNNKNISLNLSKNSNDPLSELLNNFLEGKSSIKINNELTLFTTKNIEILRKKINPYIGVVGAGIFGITSSWILGKNGFSVDLFEEKSDIIQCASFNNQYRIHKGYHYPRSYETAFSSKNSELKFREYYGDSYMNSNHYYNIAKNDSKTSSSDYLIFLKKLGLEFTELNLDNFIYNDKISLSLEVTEKIYNQFILKDICYKYINENNVNLILNNKPDLSYLNNNYDYIILSTFKNNNNYISDNYKKDYNYQLYESIVLDLPEKYKNKSFIILDGNYACISPYGNTGLSVVIDVVNSIHEDILGKDLKIPEEYHEILDKGIIDNPFISNKNKIITTLKKYFKNIDESQYKGSIFTYKVIIPGSNKNVDRPTEVTLIDDKIINVFSGKVVTCIDAGFEVLKIIKK